MDKLKKPDITTPEATTNSKMSEKEAQEADTTVIPSACYLGGFVEKEAKLLGISISCLKPRTSLFVSTKLSFRQV